MIWKQSWQCLDEKTFILFLVELSLFCFFLALNCWPSSTESSSNHFLRIPASHSQNTSLHKSVFHFSTRSNKPTLFTNWIKAMGHDLKGLSQVLPNINEISTIGAVMLWIMTAVEEKGQQKRGETNASTVWWGKRGRADARLHLYVALTHTGLLDATCLCACLTGGGVLSVCSRMW